MSSVEKYKAKKNNVNVQEGGEEVPKSQDEINSENNANNLRNAAEVAANSSNPYAKAIGTAVKVADKVSGGKATQKLGEKVTKLNKVAPGGKMVQDASNKINESGVGDKIGQAAAAKNNGQKGISTGGGGASKITSSSSSFSSSGGDSKTFLLIVIGVLSLIFPLLFFVTIFAQQDVINLGATNSTTITSGNFSGNIDSTLYNGGTTSMLSSGETLLSRLGEEKINQINNQIKNDVANAGAGTAGGVATAAYDFIKLLLDNGINMTYTYGGGHGTVSEGIQGSWGYGNGLDCSSFVSWALYNGGCKNYTASAVSGTQATYGVETTANMLKTGDLIANEKHVMLVLSNTGTSVIVAHARGLNYGIVFSENTYESLSGYSLRDMTSYYQQNCSS